MDHHICLRNDRLLGDMFEDKIDLGKKEDVEGPVVFITGDLMKRC